MRDRYVREVTVADPVATALRSSVTPRTGEPGDQFTIGGRLVRADDPNANVGGESMRLLRRPLGTSDWETVVEQRTPADGLLRYVDTPERSTEYMWRFPGSPRYGPSESPVVLAEVLLTSTSRPTAR